MTRTKAENYLFESEPGLCLARDLLIGAQSLIVNDDGLRDREAKMIAAARFLDDAIDEVTNLVEMLYAATDKSATLELDSV